MQNDTISEVSQYFSDNTKEKVDLATTGWLSWNYETCTLKLKRFHKMPQAQLRLAQILCNDYLRPDEAQSKLNDCIKSNNHFEVAKVQEVQGDIFMKKDKEKNLQRALKHYNKSYSIEPDNLRLLLKMGKCYNQCQEFDNAVVQYTRALDKEPQNTGIMFKLGWAYLRAGEKEQGLIWMRRSIGKGEVNVKNLIKLSEVLMRQDDEDHQKEAVTIL